MNIAVAYPSTWIPKENARPGVVHEFRDPATSGTDALLIVVPPQPKRASGEEFRQAFADPKAQEKIMPGARHRKMAWVDGLAFPCIALDYDLEMPRFAPAVVQVRNYLAFLDGKMVQIQFYGVAPADQDVRIGRQEMMDAVLKSIRKP